jgi:putative restriction endonuclease
VTTASPDIHTLFDLDRLAIDPRTHEVRLSRRLRGTSYHALDGVVLTAPASESQQPDEQALYERWNRF